ncbi:MAG: GTPase HflX [Bacillaceae bacterium]
MMKMGKRGILVNVNINHKRHFEESIIEFRNLCKACHIHVAAQMVQNAKKVNPSYYVGAGKVEELAAMVAELDADIVLFNNELSSSQIKNIEEKVNCTVMDRTALILDIFAQRAKTKEAKLQVEVARLQYELPRLIGSNENLGRQSGGIGTKNRGSGEKKLELDRRRIEEKITDLNKELEVLKYQRTTQRNKRKKANIPNVALVGYTNAGKSSIMNALVEMYMKKADKKVFEEDMLFATLETYVRNIKLPDNKTFLLSDTVGFVSNLPHNLVKAFRSTLEEICQADLLIHVVDISNPSYENHIAVTKATLKEIGADHIPMITVYNKVDLIDASKEKTDGIYLSAKKNIGIDELVDKLDEYIFTDYVSCKLLIPYTEGKVLSYLNQHVAIHDAEYIEAGAILNIDCSESDYSKYKSYEMPEMNN